MDKQEQVQELYEATYNEIQEYARELEGAESEQSSLLARIQQQEESLNELLAKAKQEEIAAQKAEEARRGRRKPGSRLRPSRRPAGALHPEIRRRARVQALRHPPEAEHHRPDRQKTRRTKIQEAVRHQEHIWGDSS